MFVRISVVAAMLFVVHCSLSSQPRNLARSINPTLGTPAYGTRWGAALFEGPSAPHGLVNASPWRADKACDSIAGVSLVNVNGTGCNNGAGGHVVVSMRRGKPQGIARCFLLDSASYLPHQMSLLYQGIHHDVTATQRAAMHRFSLPGIADIHLRIALGLGYANAPEVEILYVSDTLVQCMLYLNGFCDQRHYRRPLYVGIRLHGFAQAVIMDDGQNHSVPYTGKPVVLTATPLSLSSGARIGCSLTSIEGAMLNLEQEIGTRTFDIVAQNTRAAWDQAIGRFEVSGGTLRDSTILATTLYRALQHPSVAGDVDATFRTFATTASPGSTNAVASGYERTTFHDIWGFTQTNAGFYGMYYQDFYHNVLETWRSMMLETGESPQWDYLGRQLYIMGGDPFPLLALDAARKGQVNGAWLQDVLPVLSTIASTRNDIRGDNDMYLEYGYIPWNGRRGGQWIGASVANTIEYATADRAIGECYGMMGLDSAASEYLARGQRLWNVFDPTIGYYRERSVNKEWKTPYDLDTQEGYYDWPVDGAPGFKEGTMREALFLAQWNRQRLVEELGGWNSYSVQLRTMLAAGSDYAMWNQPRFHVPYQWLYVPDSASRGQALVRSMLDTQFDEYVMGPPGNDDLGSTSLWYTHVTLGLYPTEGFENSWLVTSPRFDTVRIARSLPNGSVRPLTIIGNGAPAPAPYVSAVTVDGVPYYTTHIPDEAYRKASVVTITRSLTKGTQPRRWNRVLPDERLVTDSVLVLDIRDAARGTRVQVQTANDKYFTSVIASRIVQPRERTVSLPVGHGPVYWRIRDMADPSGELAWISPQPQPNAVRVTSLQSSPILLRYLPVSKVLMLTCNDADTEPASLELYDQLGRNVLSQRIDEALSIIPVYTLATGVYHASVRVGNAIHYRPLLIE